MLTFGKSKFLIRVIYNNGVVVDNWYSEFNLKHQDAKLTSVSWTMSSKSKLRPMFLGLHNISAVYQLKERQNIFEWIGKIIK